MRVSKSAPSALRDMLLPKDEREVRWKSQDIVYYISKKMDRYQNKYRIASARAPWWDYGWNAAYFVTICTKNRECFFGNVTGRKMVLSGIGEIAKNCWLEIPLHFSFVKLDSFIVMPNHVHGIIIIDKPEDERNAGTDTNNNNDNDNIETRLIASLQQPQRSFLSSSLPANGGFAGNKNPMLQDNLSAVIRWYKGRTTFDSRRTDAGFAWQSRFHDHIIRNEQEYQRIAQYIINNPANWVADKLK